MTVIGSFHFGIKHQGLTEEFKTDTVVSTILMRWLAN